MPMPNRRTTIDEVLDQLRERGDVDTETLREAVGCAYPALKSALTTLVSEGVVVSRRRPGLSNVWRVVGDGTRPERSRAGGGTARLGGTIKPAVSPLSCLERRAPDPEDPRLWQ